VGNLEVMMGEALLATRPVIGVSAGAHVLDAVSQHLFNGAIQALHLIPGQASSRSRGMNLGHMQGFIGIHVPDAGDNILVVEEGFDGMVQGFGESKWRVLLGKRILVVPEETISSQFTGTT